MAEADLHNLVPAIGEINADRSNYRFAQLAGGDSHYGQVPMRIDSKQRAAEPPDYAKGAAARAVRYMAETYQVRLSARDRRLMEAWDKQFPADSWECERNSRISEVQGNSNPFVVHSCTQGG
jgi:deoxyribonuclease-1